MQTAPQISKAAFLARINDRARRFAVDSYYTQQNGQTVLLVTYDDGSKKVFRGLDRAA
jgi:hypothetical protein